MRYYEDLKPGVTTKGTDTYLVTEAEIREMGERWDPQPFHVDPEAAAASPFGGLVASTVHLFGIHTRLGARGDPLAAVSALGMTNFVNHAPARPGDRLRHESTVLDRRPSKSRPGTGVVSFRGTLFNQRDEPVFSHEPTVLVYFRPVEESPPA